MSIFYSQVRWRTFLPYEPPCARRAATGPHERWLLRIRMSCLAPGPLASGLGAPPPVQVALYSLLCAVLLIASRADERTCEVYNDKLWF